MVTLMVTLLLLLLIRRLSLGRLAHGLQKPIPASTGSHRLLLDARAFVRASRGL